MRIRARTEILDANSPPDETVPIRPAVVRKDGIVVYEYLLTPNIVRPQTPPVPQLFRLPPVINLELLFLESDISMSTVSFYQPCVLDYMEVLIALCDLLVLMYRKFVDPSSASHVLHDAILKCVPPSPDIV